jgi:uncharacterized protein (TIGR03546 family)
MKYIRDRIRGIFKLDDSPRQLATAFAVGVFIAFTPTIGLHTISVLLLVWLFRLNKLAVFSGAFISNPWTMVPMYGFCLWFGLWITGAESSMPAIAWKELTFRNAFSVLEPYLWPFVAGTLLVGAVAAVLSYCVMYRAVIRYRKADMVTGTEDRKKVQEL